MIAMILCGGLGKRFRPLTEKIPKALFELKKGYTLLDRQLLSYASAGFDRVLLLASHLSERIEERYGDDWKGVSLGYVVEEKPLGTLNAIRLGLEKAGEDAMVSNGDVVCDINLKRMREEFERGKRQASMFAVRMRSPYGIVRLGKGYIESFEEKPLLDYFINGGFYCMRREVLDLLEEFKVGDIERTAFPRLAERKQLAYYTEEVPFWASIDTPKELDDARKEYENRTDKPWGHEKVLAFTPERLEKELYIMAGHRTSLHYHERRDETLRVASGAGWLELEGKRKQFRRGMEVRIKPKQVHSFIATQNTLIRERSTPYPEDVVRVKDFYKVR